MLLIWWRGVFGQSLLPEKGREGYSVQLAALNGLLHYGLSDGVDINIWVLEGDFHNSTAQWHMKHSVSFVTLENRYPDIFGAYGFREYILQVEFHSADPRIVYLCLRDKLISYNIDDGAVEAVHDMDFVEDECTIALCNCKFKKITYDLC